MPEINFEAPNDQLINQLQNILGYLECEFIYLCKDLEANAADTSLGSDLPSAKLALAAFCVERAYRIVHEKSVVNWLNLRLAAMTKVALSASA